MMIMQIHASVVTSTQRVHFFILGEFHNNTCSDKLKGTKKIKKKVESSVSSDDVWGGGGGARCGGGGYVAVGCWVYFLVINSRSPFSRL